MKIIGIMVAIVGVVVMGCGSNALADAATPITTPATIATTTPSNASANNAFGVTPTPFQVILANLVFANKTKLIVDKDYTNIVASYVAQGNIQTLDVATIIALQAAQSSLTLVDMEHLEGVLAASAPKLNANVNFAAVTNNFDLSVTNRPLVVTNLASALNYQSNFVRNFSSPDTNAYSILTNQFGQQLKGERDYATFPTNPPSSPYFAFFSAGAQFLNPYFISVPTSSKYGTLTNAGSDTVGYLEFNYINRHVLRSKLGTTEGTNWYEFGGQWQNPLKQTPDVQFDLGFLLGSGAGLTNKSYSAQTLSGSDFYTQFGLGFPLWRLQIPSQVHQVSLELSGGVTTEQTFELIHPNAFAGVGYQTAFQPFIGSASTNSCGFFNSRVGVGWIDLPSLVGTNNEVNLDGNGLPIFDFKPACEISAFLAYPLTSSLYLTVEANTYFDTSAPNSWNIKVGASIPFEKIGTAFTSFMQ